MKNSNSSQAGALDEEAFIANFENVPIVKIFSGKEVKDFLKKLGGIIENVKEDWNKRVDCIKKIRSLIVAGALNYDEFFVHLNSLLPSINASLKDLRSKVVVESCITVAYLSKNLALKFDHFAECVLINLINLIQNSTKIIASSSIVCIKFILRYTHSFRLIPMFSNSLTSKSKDIRRVCCECINIILETWHTYLIERNVSKIQDAIKIGISDADGEARAQARNAYTRFAQHFPELAEDLVNSLDVTHRKLLVSSKSASSSSLSKSPSQLLVVSSSYRSNSAIDLHAVRRAKTRVQHVPMDRKKYYSGISLPKKK